VLVRSVMDWVTCKVFARFVVPEPQTPVCSDRTLVRKDILLPNFALQFRTKLMV